LSGDCRPTQAPVVAALVGGTIAIGIGLVVMVKVGALGSYVVVNGIAQAMGLALASILLVIPARTENWLALAAALGLLATALFGVEMNGISRWVSLFGIIQIQPAFMLLPLLLCSYARKYADKGQAAAVIIAALAIGLMPDRSMTLPLCAVACAVWLADRSQMTALVLAAAVCSAVAAWVQADPLAGVAFVEDVIAHGWRRGPLQGTALTLGALAMLAPILTARRAAVEQQRAIIAFTLIWAMLLLASLIGTYPTPLLGYGASAIIGYFLSLIALRKLVSLPHDDL
jgi:hypothetical protein